MNNAKEKRTWTIYASFIFLLLIAACSSSKNTIQTDLEDQDSDFLLAHLDSTVSSFDWFSAKIKCNYYKGEEKESFEVYIKVRADSVIYLTIRKFDVTGAKVLMETDSVTFLSTGKGSMEKFYTIQSYDYINEMIGAAIDYFMVQDLLFANPNGLDFSEKYVTETHENGYYVSTLTPKQVEKAIHDRDLEDGNILRQYWLEPENYQLGKQALHSIIDTTTLVMNYSDYEMHEGIAFPLEQEMVVMAPSDTVRVEMSYFKVEFNEPQKVSLTIPDGYERR